jgi:Tfp pilus assembly protein PilX
MRNRNERGIAVIVALLSLLILSVLGASIIFVTQNEIWTSANYKLTTQSRYAAEAGVQSSVDWLINTYPVPTDYTLFDMTTSPTHGTGTDSGKEVILSAMNGDTMSGWTTTYYPTTSVQDSFNSALNAQPVSGMGVSATYSVKAKLHSMRKVLAIGNVVTPIQVWEVRSRGDVVGARNAQVELKAKVENVANPTFSYAAFGVDPTCGSVSVGGNGTTDSYDSRFGTYATTQTASGGNLGSNGNIYVGGTSTTVYGDVETPKSGTGACTGGSVDALETTGGATVTDGVTQLPAPVQFPVPAAPSPAPPTTSQSISGSVNLCGTGVNVITGCTLPWPLVPNTIDFAPGSYGDVSINGETLELNAGTYIMNSLTLLGAATLKIVTGPVVLQLAGNGLTGASPSVLSFSGTSQLINSTGAAENFQVMYGGPYNIKLTGGTSAYGVVYAPASNVSYVGGSDWYGSVIGKTVNDNGGTSLHYDRSLADKFWIVGKYRVAALSWEKF